MKKQSTTNPYVTNKSFVVSPDGKAKKNPASKVTRCEGDMRAKGGK